MLEQLALHTPLTIHATNEQDLDPRPCTVNDHLSVFAHKMMVIDPGEKPTHMLTWKTTAFIRHIMPRSHDDRFPIPLWDLVLFKSRCSYPRLTSKPSTMSPCRQFSFDPYGDHIQTCQRQSAALPMHEWIVYKLSLLSQVSSVGHSRSSY